MLMRLYVFDRTELTLAFEASVGEISEDKLNYFPCETPRMLCIFSSTRLKRGTVKKG